MTELLLSLLVLHTLDGLTTLRRCHSHALTASLSMKKNGRRFPARSSKIISSVQLIRKSFFFDEY